MKPARYRCSLLSICGATSVLSLLLLAFLLWRLSWVGLYIHGAYRDLDARGAINREELAKVVGDGIADDWATVVSEYLLGGDIWRQLIWSAVVASGLIGSNVLCLALLWARSCKDKHNQDKRAKAAE